MSPSCYRNEKGQHHQRESRNPPSPGDRLGRIRLHPRAAAQRTPESAQRERKAGGIGQQRHGDRQQRYHDNKPILKQYIQLNT